MEPKRGGGGSQSFSACSFVDPWDPFHLSLFVVLRSFSLDYGETDGEDQSDVYSTYSDDDDVDGEGYTDEE